MGYGPVVIDGVVQYYSVSGLKKGDPESDGGCPRRWYFRYVLGKREVEGEAAKFGTACHDLLAHYLRTGEDVLNPVTRAGKHLLPRPGADLLVEFESFGAIMVAGVPMLLKVDLLHDRDTYVTTDGEWAMQGKGVVEVLDHKTTKSMRYAKTGMMLGNDIQMLGYGALAAVQPGVDFVRLSQIFYLTEGKPDASKSTTLLPAKTLLERFYEKLEKPAEMLKSVARAARVEDVKANRGACDSFGGCPHRAYCPKTPEEELSGILGGAKAKTILNR